MVCVLVSAPLRVSSLSLTAQRKPVAIVHYVEEIIGMEASFPLPKLHIVAKCGRTLLGLVGVLEERSTSLCDGCRPYHQRKSYNMVVIPSWRDVLVGSGLPFDMEDERTFVMRDWRTGLPRMQVID